MLSPAERKKKNFAKSLLPSFTAEMKKYEELYQLFANDGYTKELCDLFADQFVNEVKKPAHDDIIAAASLYNRVYDHKSAEFYLEMLSEKKMSSDDKFAWCVEMLKTISLLGRWRDAEDFRTENINFMQNYAAKKPLDEMADMYISLALADCAAKRYPEALKLLKFGYKPHGRNDTSLLKIFITVVYIFARSGDEEGLEGAVSNALGCLKLFSGYDFAWTKEYYEKCVSDAAQGIL